MCYFKPLATCGFVADCTFACPNPEYSLNDRMKELLRRYDTILLSGHVFDAIWRYDANW